VKQPLFASNATKSFIYGMNNNWPVSRPPRMSRYISIANIIMWIIALYIWAGLYFLRIGIALFIIAMIWTIQLAVLAVVLPFTIVSSIRGKSDS
jgi:hypothetical protein